MALMRRGGWVLLLASTMNVPVHGQDTTQALAEDIPPAGYGTLRQEDIALRIQAGDIRVRALPLDERIIRLLAPDSYRALSGLKKLKTATIDTIAQRYAVSNPTLFVVTFFAERERAPFTPEDVTITSRGRFFRPLGIVPISPRWSEHQLALRQTALAVYVFEPGIEVLEPFTVTYDGRTAAGWGRMLRILDQERAAVRARAQTGGQ